MRETRTEDWQEWGKTSGGRSGEVAGGHNSGFRKGCVRVSAGCG